MRHSVAAALCLTLGSVYAAPGRARAQELPVMECANSPAALPLATEGVAYNASILTSTSPNLGGMTAGGLPPGLALVENRWVRGTPTAPGSYTIGLRKVYRSGCGKLVPAKGGEEGAATYLSAESVTLKVRDTHAPAIGSFTVTPAALGAAGGSVTLSVQASDNAAVSRVLMTTVHPDGHSGSSPVPLTAGSASNGTWSITFSLGGNATSAAASYSFTVAVNDADGNTAKSGPTKVVIAAKAPPSPVGMPLKRP